MLKKLIVGGLGSSLALALMAMPASAVTVPAECVGMTFDHVITSNHKGAILEGLTGNNLIIGLGGDIIRVGDGNNCIVSGKGTIVHAGNGDNVITTGAASNIHAGSGFNTITSGSVSIIHAGVNSTCSVPNDGTSRVHGCI